jgi:ATP-dependent Clp protease ATP-binding subunit ClpA
MLAMEKQLKDKVIGQDEAVAVVTRVVGMAGTSLKKRRRPMAVFLFVGPRGVGKKTLARALAELLFNLDDKMLWLDMLEYTEAHHVARLIGPLEDYFRSGVYEGVLTEWLRRKPYSLILIENVEKAHTAVLKAFQDLFKGRLTDYRGEIIDAGNAVFIMTSTTMALEKEGTMNRQDMLAYLKRILSSEFLSCTDEMVSFRPLGPASVFRIASNLVDSLRRRLGEQNILLDVDDKALQLMCREGYCPECGVSLMERAINLLLTTPLAAKLLDNEVVPGDRVLVTVQSEGLNLAKV